MQEKTDLLCTSSPAQQAEMMSIAGTPPGHSPLEDVAGWSKLLFVLPGVPGATGSGSRNVQARLMCGLEAPETNRPWSGRRARGQDNPTRTHFHAVQGDAMAS